MKSRTAKKKPACKLSTYHVAHLSEGMMVKQDVFADSVEFVGEDLIFKHRGKIIAMFRGWSAWGLKGSVGAVA